MRIIEFFSNKVNEALKKREIIRAIRKKGGRVSSRVVIICRGEFIPGNKITFHHKGIDRIPIMQIIIHPSAHFQIGDNSGVSQSSINCMKEITIGSHVKIGSGCLLMDSDFHSMDWRDRTIHTQDVRNAKSSAIIIGDYVFIGAHSIITKGVTIGNRSVIAAGSVVVKDIPSDELWGGNPAKFIRKLL